MRQRLCCLICFWILLLSCFIPAFAEEPQTSIHPKWPELNPNAKECGGFSEDSLVLEIRIHNRVIKLEFCSSYGKADAKVIKDSRGANYLLLKFAKGRGTHVTADYLSIYRIEKKLEECVLFPVYEPAGKFANIYYDYTIQKPAKGGLLFSITGRIEDDHDADDKEYLPKETKRTILIQ